MVPEVQTSSRCCRFLLNLGNRGQKVLAQRDFCLQPVFVAEGTRISERRRWCDAKTQLTIPGALPSSSICRVVGPRLLGSAGQRLLPDLHSVLGWTTILSSRLCPEICWLATAAVNPHPPNILRDASCAWNGQHDTGPFTLARCCWEASPHWRSKTSSTAGSSKGQPADCWKQWESRLPESPPRPF